MKYFISLIGLIIIISCSETPNDLPLDSQEGVEAIVTFSVDMSYQIELGNFDSGSDFIDIAGGFNNWGDGTNYPLIEIANNVYEISFTNFEVGEEIEFKFRINGNWDTAEFPNGGENRSHLVVQGENILAYWFNDETEN